MAKTSSKPKAEYAIQTVANALRMLEVFHTETEMGVSDLARRLKLHKNNAFRLLATLELAGYIQQSSETELYRLGPRCLELGLAYTRSHDLIEQARPILEELAARVGETVHLGTLAEDEVIHLDGILPKQLVLTGSRVGQRLPSHCTALGKALLAGRLSASLAAAAAAPSSSSTSTSTSGSSSPATPSASAPTDRHDAPREESATRLGSGLAALQARDLASFTGTTITDSTKLVEELRNVELRGYAVDLEEYADGLCCVAAPVRDATSQVIAALSLSGPSFRLSESVLHGDAGRAVAAAATRLSRELGAPI